MAVDRPPPVGADLADVFRAEPEARSRSRSRPRGPDAVDVVFGLIVPPLLLLVDPGVFAEPGGGWLDGLAPFGLTPYLLWMKPGAHVAIGLGLVALAATLWRHAVRPDGGPGPRVLGEALLTGTLAAAAVHATVIGAALLPVSVPGTLVLIGALGLLPFATARVLSVNARRAWGRAQVGEGAARLALAAFGLALALPVAVNLGVNVWIGAAERDLTAPSEPARRAALATLERLRPYVSLRSLHERWLACQVELEKRWLAEAFERLEGGKPEAWGVSLVD